MPLGASYGKVGYAGGLNPDNILKHTKEILAGDMDGEFWMDMESGVRTYDWFDLKKIESVCESLKPFI